MTQKIGKLPLAAAAVVLVLIAGKLYAEPLFGTSSPQGDVTLGKFESDADNYMSVRNYANMDFGKWWSVISYKAYLDSPTPNSSDLVQVGFATRIGGLYAGLSYNGNGWKDLGSLRGAGDNINTYTQETISGKTWKVFDIAPQPLLGFYGLRNEAALLLGFADMGLKLYYASNYQSNTQADYAVRESGGLKYYKSWQEECGHINPGITWGMSRELLPGRGIKPQVNIDLDLIRDNQAQEEFADASDPQLGTKGKQIIFSNNAFIPGINLGLGGFSLTRVNNFSLDLDLDYGIKMYFYDNEYSYADSNSKYQIKRLQGGRVRNSSQFADIFEIQHALSPSINAGWSGDRLGLALKLGVLMTSYTKTETFKALKPDINGIPLTDGSIVKHADDDKITEYTLEPAIDLAMQWAIVPSRLFLNAGGKLSVFKIISNTLDRYVYEYGDLDRTKIEVTNTFYSASTNLFLGLTFNLSPNLELQAALGVGSNNDINVFNSSFSNLTGGFLNFGNILVTLKF